MKQVDKARATWSGLNRYPYFRALVKQAGIALWAVGVVWAIAWGMGTGVSVLAVLLIHILISAYLTAEAEVEPELDGAAAALEEFGDTPLGALMANAREQLATARRGIGREAVMYRPLDRLVRATRKVERRLALDPAMRPAFNRVITRELPLIASTAQQYVTMQGKEAVDGARLTTTEGILRDAAERIEALITAEPGPQGAVIGMARLDADAEVLADYMATDLGTARGRAEVLRIAHRLEKAAPGMVPELEYKIKAVTELLQTHADDPSTHALIAAKGVQVAETAEVADMDTGGRAALRMALEDWRAALIGLSTAKETS